MSSDIELYFYFWCINRLAKYSKKYLISPFVRVQAKIINRSYGGKRLSQNLGSRSC